MYEDRNRAEDMVETLSKNGVRIVILADGMPEDRETRSKTFLGVTCNVVQFENGYPILYTKDFGEMDCDLFPRGYSKWVTYYLNGLHNVGGTISDNNVELAFFGTGLNENLCYIGLNIPFYYYLTQDVNAEKLMQWVMGMDPGVLPGREIYPMAISYGNNEIAIDSEADFLNTGLSYHDCFRSDQEIFTDNNLLIVRKGHTQIKITPPYFIEGILVTVAGLLLLVLLLWYVRRSDLRDKGLISKKEKKAEEKDPEKKKEEKEYFYPELQKVKEEENKEEKEEIEEEKTEEKIEEKIEEIKEEKEEIKEETKEEIKQNSEPVETETSAKKFDKDFDIPMKSGDDFDIPFGNR